jgi:serine/threonine protein kinase
VSDTLCDVGASEGERFGRYEVLFPLAAGGMAEVYVARARGEAGFQKLVAVKRMRPALADDARFVTMFLDEGRVAANIQSPHVVATHDLGRASDRSLYLVMDLVRGVSLHQLLYETVLEGEPFPLDIAVEILAQAAQGLHDAHEATSPDGEPLAIVHRDCSPHNILVDVRGQVRITDFGIAHALQRQTHSLAGEMKGKLSYLSPEQARGLPVDRRTDVFILGVVAWETVAGRRLFTAETPVEALHKISEMPIPDLRTLRPDCPDLLSSAIEQALMRDPGERFSTAEAFGRALRASLPRPAKSEVGAFVRRFGGPQLDRLESNIRETYGSSSTLAGGEAAPADEGSGPQPASVSTPPPPSKKPAAFAETLVPSETAALRAEQADALGRTLRTDGQEAVSPPEPPSRRRPALALALDPMADILDGSGPRPEPPPSTYPPPATYPPAGDLSPAGAHLGASTGVSFEDGPLGDAHRGRAHRGGRGRPARSHGGGRRRLPDADGARVGARARAAAGAGGGPGAVGGIGGADGRGRGGPGPGARGGAAGARGNRGPSTGGPATAPAPPPDASSPAGRGQLPGTERRSRRGVSGVAVGVGAGAGVGAAPRRALPTPPRDEPVGEVVGGEGDFTRSPRTTRMRKRRMRPLSLATTWLPASSSTSKRLPG